MDNESPIRIDSVSGAGELSAIAREQAEIQARILAAKRFPRNELDAGTKLKNTMKRPAMAEKSFWSFKRGKDDQGRDIFIEGPSAHTAREAGRCWGNIVSGFRVVSMDETYAHLRAFATDLETNTTKEFEEKFKKLVYRKNKGWISPDERQLRELVNKHGAIIERNAILQIIPKDIVDDALVVAKRTLKEKATGDLKENKQELLKKLVGAFAEYGVTAKHLEDYLDHDLAQITPDELVTLRGIYSSIEAGNSKAFEYFGAKTEEESEAAKDLTSDLLGGTK